jgi:hypothetical protein
MGLDLWFQQDVARILAATHETMRSSMGAATPRDASMQTIALAESYRRGFGDALRAVAVAFGVAAPTVTSVAEWSSSTLPAIEHRGAGSQR